MAKKRTFISFDYDHDKDLKDLFVGQSHNEDSPFEIVDMSIKETISSNWKVNARRRIKGCDVVVIICGMHTNSATGVTAELKIAQEEKVPYFCLKGRANKHCVFPIGVRSTDKMYKWTWDNLKKLFSGAR